MVRTRTGPPKNQSTEPSRSGPGMRGNKQKSLTGGFKPGVIPGSSLVSIRLKKKSRIQIGSKKSDLTEEDHKRTLTTGVELKSLGVEIHSDNKDPTNTPE